MTPEYIVSIVVVGILGIWDIRVRRIPVIVLLVYAGSGILYNIIVRNGAEIGEYIMGCVPGCAALLLAFGTREKIGKGDGYTMMAVGIWMGIHRILLIGLISLGLLFVGAVVCWVSRVVSGKYVNGSGEIPFIPYLWGALVIAGMISVQ